MQDKSLIKQAVVVHSGGMDSSLCLAYAIKKHSADNVLSLSFNYAQRHTSELKQAQKICYDWQVDHMELDIRCLEKITHNALINHELEIQHQTNQSPSTLVVGRNGLMTRLAAIHADDLKANSIYLGVIEVESANSGYRDCTRHYMDLMQEILRIDLANSNFKIVTPVVHMTKQETMEFGLELGVLEYLLTETISCYEGIPRRGCDNCPACKLRNTGIKEFLSVHPNFQMPYKL
ncbi:MAG: 7-cyano-7-deazaguanine synthase QueC [Gammaproteobacteria bacterium]|nr:7-cyano-7-deazaguanine synthase QueC [Gammaproteobacteria bacterium]